jgi:hypothetical protein
MESNELIERYVYEVGRRLPRKMQADIQLELSSLLHDTLKEQADAEGVEPTPEMAAAVLRDFGKPKEIAAQYHREQYLIGPQLFPTFKTIIVIVLTIISIGHAVGFIFSLARGEAPNFWLSLGNMLVDYAQAVIFNAGLVTFVFAILERAPFERTTVSEMADWDPFELPEVKDPDRIKRSEVTTGIFWTIFFIILFNYFPEYIGYIGIEGGEVKGFSLLASEFFVHVPWLTSIWSLEVLLKVIVLRDGRWQRSTRWAEFGLGLFTLYVMYQIVIGGPIFTLSILTSIMRVVIWIGLVFGVFGAIGQLYRLLLGRPFTPTETIKSRLA